MRRPLATVIATLLVGVIAACGGGTPAKTVTLAAVGDSGVSGTATLTDAGGGQTKVVITAEDNLNPDMPTFIEKGTCAARVKEPGFTLSDIRDGASTSTIAVSMADLTATPYHIQVHSGPEDFSLSACGDIK